MKAYTFLFVIIAISSCKENRQTEIKNNTNSHYQPQIQSIQNPLNLEETKRNGKVFWENIKESSREVSARIKAETKNEGNYIKDKTRQINRWTKKKFQTWRKKYKQKNRDTVLVPLDCK